MARNANAALAEPYLLYIDEFGSCLAGDENAASLLSEARKFGLGLVLATQYAGQLRSGSATRMGMTSSYGGTLAAVLGNAATVCAFRLGPEDAALLAPIFAPSLSPLDLTSLPNWEGYMRLHLNRQATLPFSFNVSPDPTPPDARLGDHIVRESKGRWNVDAAKCDAAIQARRELIDNL